jgi:hypothetical protein
MGWDGIDKRMSDYLVWLVQLNETKVKVGNSNLDEISKCMDE